MKTIQKSLFVVCAAGAAACAAVAADGVAVVPAPREMSVTGGECAAKGGPKFETVASIPPEGYEISVTKDGVTVRSSDAAGAFYARMTLAQLIALDKTKRVSVGDITGFVRKMQYSIGNKDGLGLVSMEVMYI